MKKIMSSAKLLTILFLTFVLITSCDKGSFSETENGIIVNLKKNENQGASKIRLTVLSEKIIRVEAVADDLIDRKSLIVLENNQIFKDYSIIEGNDFLKITTSAIIAKIDIITGEVCFSDLEGNILLKEKDGGHKIFKEIEVEGQKGYTFEQVFASPDDEAFYGLGQHQSDEWNYKGKNEVLFQYNTKVSVPFVVSNKNYGILWDNYSLTKFGNPEEYKELSSFNLYNKKGEKGGLTATYTQANGEIFVERNESIIDYENLETIKKFPEGFEFYNSNIVWEGEIEADETTEYFFKLYYAGYTTVEIDGKEVVEERWRTAWNPNTYKFKVKLEKGKKYPIKLKWRPDGGVSYIGLKALKPKSIKEQNNLTLWSEMGQELDYYFIHGKNMDEIISGYRQLTGKARILPSWAYGFWQSRERYKTQDEVVGALAEFRKRNIPIDNIVIDWSYWEEDQWGSHEFDKERFPNPQKMMDDIHKLNGRAMISVWPKFYLNTDNYKELNNKGFIYQQAIKDSVKDWIGSGYIGSFYDPYTQDARDMFWKQISEKIYTLGMDAWWMDASEPDILSNASLEYRKKLSTPTGMGTSTEYLNTYALMNAQGIYEGQRGENPDSRIFLLTRSGFAGLQRYSTATWSGDIGTRWEDMKAQITAGMNFAISGIPYWTMDIGGFCVEKRYETAQEGSEDLEEWRELNTRWYQFGAFVPLFRAHGQYPFREIYNIAPEDHKAYKSILYYNKLRYKLMPYIYSLAGKVYFDDYTLMRALVMDFSDDKYVENIDDQYMFGPSIMVCPVYEYKAEKRDVYLPEGTKWFDFYSGNILDGGQTVKADAPYEKMPLFIKAGSIIPFGPEIEFTNQKPDAPINIVVYAGEDAKFNLYEDEGLNFNYEKNKYSNILFNWSEKNSVLKIEKRIGSFEGMIENRTFKIFLASDLKGLDFESAKCKTVEYSGEELIVELRK